MRAWALRGAPLVAAASLAIGCPAPDVGEGSGSASEAPDDEPGARVVGQVDVIDLCGVSEAKVVSFRARKVGCVPGPPAPCTLKVDPYEEVVGDAATCPASQTARDMTVRIESPGRYQIEAQALTPGGYVGKCFAPQGGEAELEVSAAQIEARARIAVYGRAGPCVVP